eukprot:XP_019927168.1 PREDICTED: hepatocyte growth factor-like [Crassostrea gigas]
MGPTVFSHPYNQSLGNQEDFYRNLAKDDEEEADDFPRNCKKTANGVDYYGKTNVSKSGSPYNYWADTSERSQAYTFLKDHFNFCRNPFGDDKKPWCYSGSTWDYCDIPMYDFSRSCKKTANGVDYYGGTNVTKSRSPCNYWADTSQQNHTYTFLDDQFNYCRNPFGEYSDPWCYSECKRWDQQSPHTHTYQSLGNQENFCRNLAKDEEEEAGPWCYTLDPDIRWQTCGIPLCYDFSRNCKKTANGVDYYGKTNVSKSGSPCNYWADTSERSQTYTFLKDQFNFCRNPFGDDKKPWCYSGSTWDYCD